MALHQIEIRKGEIILNEAFVGNLRTKPPEGVRQNTEVSAREGAVLVTVRWTVEKSLDHLLPLEILGLRLGEFYPEAAFIGGRSYHLTNDHSIAERKLPFPYNSYYKFRIRARARYDAALFTKMPVACWQERHRAFAIAFPKTILFPLGFSPLFIKATGAQAVVDFSAALLPEFEVIRKPFGWFGTGAKRHGYTLRLDERQAFDARFLLVAADTWEECVCACMDHVGLDSHMESNLSPGRLDQKLRAALRFYNRVWDDRNRTHLHIPRKNIPGFESKEFKHSHVTDDLTKLVLFRRLAEMGHDKAREREKALSEKLSSKAYCYEMAGKQLWHTTTYFNGDGLIPFTHHGIGFVGFPGGMATVVRRLFEYCSLTGDEEIDPLARSGADWLTETQTEAGWWPAVFRGKPGKRMDGCVAATAEAVRALVAAYRRTRKQRYRSAAEAGLRFVNRNTSFFACRQYLRDVDPSEADGISSEACIHANLDWHELDAASDAISQARKWGVYALQWIRPGGGEFSAVMSFDGLASSITPRIDLWGGLLTARAFLRLAGKTVETMWENLAWQLFENIAALQERDGGFSETWFFDYPTGLESIHIEPTFVTDSFVEFLLDALKAPEKERTAERHSQLLIPVPSTHQNLELSASNPSFVGILQDRPEFSLGEKLGIRPAFDGCYGWKRGLVHALYTMLREVYPGRQILKLVPIMRILFNRHRLNPPPSEIGGADAFEVMRVETFDSGNGSAMRRYLTPLHAIDLSILANGMDSGKRQFADLEFVIRTLAGDLGPRQVRIDLVGEYTAASALDNNELLVSVGEKSYTLQVIEGSVDGILRDADKFALDISLSSNWNFFGDYRLRLRVLREPARETRE